jgi:hypothetical protein
MRHPALALSTLLVGLTPGGSALAHPAFYTEVIQDLDAVGCPPSTFDTEPGCTNLCHVDDPNEQGAELPPGYRQPFCALLMQDFNWEGYATGQASTLDAPLAKLKADPTYAKVVSTVQDGCSSPSTEILAAAAGDAGDGGGGGGLSFGSSGPVYGCAVGPLGAAAPAAALGVWGIALAAVLAARRRKRSARLTLALAGTCGLVSACYYPTDGVAPSPPDAGVDVTVQKCSGGQTDAGHVDATFVHEASVPDATADVPIFTIEAGITWHSLYRDYFGPTGVATCAGTGISAGACHGEKTGNGYTSSCTLTGCFLCPDGDASTACWQSITSVGDGGANVILPGQSFNTDYLSQVLCSIDASTGSMPYNGNYCFTGTDFERIGDWVNAGAQNN